MDSRRVVVIGGGLTGLAAAHRLIELADDLKSGLEVSLVEGSDRLGGVVGTAFRDGYLVEQGADSFITNKPWAVDLCRRLGLESELVPMDARYAGLYVLREGHPVTVPAGFTLLTPGKAWPMLTSPLFSWSAKLRMLAEPFVPRRTEDTDESLADFARRRVGKEVFERLIQPLIGGIYTSDPEKLSMQATMQRFVEMEREWGSLWRGTRRGKSTAEAANPSTVGVRYGLFAAPQQGMSRLLDTLADRIRQRASVRTGFLVESIQACAADSPTSGSVWQIRSSDGQMIEADALILACASYRAAALLRPSAPELADKLEQIEYASSAIVASGHQLTDLAHPLDAYGLVIPHLERRRILAVSFTSRKYSGRAPEGRTLLRTFVGGALQPELMQLDDEEILTLVKSELTDILGMQRPPEWMQVFRYERAMPQFHVGHLDRIAEIERMLQTVQGLQLAGNAYRGVGVPDVIHSGEQAAERTFAAWRGSESIEAVNE